MLLFEWCRAKAQRVHVRLVHGIVLVTLVCIKMIQTARSTTNTCKDREPCTWLQAPHHPTSLTPCQWQPHAISAIQYCFKPFLFISYIQSITLFCFSLNSINYYIMSQLLSSCYLCYPCLSCSFFILTLTKIFAFFFVLSNCSHLIFVIIVILVLYVNFDHRTHHYWYSN